MAPYLLFLLAVSLGYCISPNELGSDISLLINNDLLGPGSPSAGSGLILLSNRSRASAPKACVALGEALWAGSSASIQPNLDYLKYQNYLGPFWTASGAIDGDGIVKNVSQHSHLPVLCTQSAPFSNSTWQNTERQTTVHSNNEYITGFRDRLSFRFLGVRYAPQPRRFTYPSLYKGSGGNVSATSFGPQCLQGDGGSEDCLFLNIWTPYLPAHGGSKSLKPVMFWIHGGAFQAGTGNDPTFDGGNIASRGDVVLVAINYRLSAFGFLALDDGVTNGNFGIADQITALDWVRLNIQDFGGDPDRVTIFGQSAGAASVRALLASPKSGSVAAAIAMSNLGGGGYGTTYSKWMSIQESLQISGNALLDATGCSDVKCLQDQNASIINTAGANVRYPVVDGTYLTTTELYLNGTGLQDVHVMEGVMRDDGAALVTFIDTTSLPQSLTSNGLNSSLDFAVPNGPNATLNVWNTTARIGTDNSFRCIDQASAYAAYTNRAFAPDQYFYEFNRSYQLPGFDPNGGVCDAPATAEFPHGDPSLEYWKCHSGELFFTFGTILFNALPLRDSLDIPFSQLIVDSWTSFARTYNPNPDRELLKARHYSNTTLHLDLVGEWKPVGEKSVRELQWPSLQMDFRDIEQCAQLGWPLSYYLDAQA